MKKLLVGLFSGAIGLATNGYPFGDSVPVPANGMGKQAIARPDVPDALKAPAGEEVILVGRATGVQIYVCQAGTNPPFAWTFKAPEADLSDASGKKMIHHFAGPTWKHIDGSEVAGKVTAKQDAPKPDAIRWLLLTATSHAGQGVLTRVTSIQRIHTDGGVAPNANTCDASKTGQESRSAYSADYYFYASEK
jgi:hypothetical protein